MARHVDAVRDLIKEEADRMTELAGDHGDGDDDMTAFGE